MVAGPRPDEVHRDRHGCRDEVGDPEQEAPVGEVDHELVSLCRSRLELLPGVEPRPSNQVTMHQAKTLRQKQIFPTPSYNVSTEPAKMERRHSSER